MVGIYVERKIEWKPECLFCLFVVISVLCVFTYILLFYYFLEIVKFSGEDSLKTNEFWGFYHGNKIPPFQILLFSYICCRNMGNCFGIKFICSENKFIRHFAWKVFYETNWICFCLSVLVEMYLQRFPAECRKRTKFVLLELSQSEFKVDRC